MSNEVDGVTDDAPWEKDEGGFSLTLKSGKGYDDSWFVIRAKTTNEMKRRIISAFDMKTDDDTDPMELSLVELMNNAQVEFRALSSVQSAFPGARVISDQRSNSRPAQEETPADPDAPLLAEIEATTTVADLQKIWARETSQNRPLNDKTKAAWKAKGQELQKESK